MNLAVIHAIATSSRESDSRPELALIALLEQLRGLLERLPTSFYRAKPAPRVSGSVGQHVRHVLDHVEALVGNAASDDFSYDHRHRGTQMEVDPAAAMIEIDRLVCSLATLASLRTDRTVRITSLLDRSGRGVVAQSTIARELAFVVQHTTHHNAIIALLLDRLGWDAPDGFGLAPSTPTTH